MTMLGKVLVANRGEIARRVFASCAKLGIGTVAVYSDADAEAPHATEADVAVRLPGSSAAQTYLRADLLLEAARAAGADAVHPGYGFLSENAEFAAAVADAGLCWIGPDAEAIAAMGSKVEAKRIMAEAGVPVLTELDPEQATETDFPLLVKASAGGGGRGMRVVRDRAGLAEAIALARTEAESAFGDGTVFCEPYLENGRHIEVQVLADGHGTVLALGERECSIQRRHQKVLEEAPSPLVERTEGMRERLCAAARAAAEAIGYVGAGTVEFLADDQGRFYFLEMNTRLQVEHPVTECVTGLDLVDWQLRIAEGARLGPEPPPIRGHAIEVRLYAEDPAADYAPQSGTLHAFTIPGVDSEFAVPPNQGLRLDAGVRAGSVVGVHYDPMLAKLICRAPNRTEAARRLANACARASIHGLRTNRDQLVRVLRDPDFLAGETDTAFLGTHEVNAPLATPETVRHAALAAALAEAAAQRSADLVLGALPSGWRNVPSVPQHRVYRYGDTEYEVGYQLTRSGLRAEGYDQVRLCSASETEVVLEISGLRTVFRIGRFPGQHSGEQDDPGLLGVDSALGSVSLTPVPRFTEPGTDLLPGSLLAETPGTVVRLAVSTSDKVKAGDPLLWLEAMKMQHQIRAPHDGTVAELRVSEGDQVDVGMTLAVVVPEGESE